MKKYYLALLAVSCIYIGSIHYRLLTTSVLDKFPIKDFYQKDQGAKVFLIYFFSINCCEPCLGVIETLNNLPGFFKVVGLVPNQEIGMLDEVRRVTRAQFEIRGGERYRKYLPNYFPTLYAVITRGEVFFILPGVPGEQDYFQRFLEAFIHRAKELLG